MIFFEIRGCGDDPERLDEIAQLLEDALKRHHLRDAIIEKCISEICAVGGEKRLRPYVRITVQGFEAPHVQALIEELKGQGIGAVCCTGRIYY